MRSFLRDLSYGLRMWLKTPGLTLVALLSLAVGIGVNSTVFGFVNAVLFKPMSVSNPAGLVYVFAGERNKPYGSASYDRYLEFSKQNDVFSGLAAYASPPVLLTSGGHTQEISAEVVSVNYFSVFDVRLQRGQAFTFPEQSISEPAVVISDNFWRRQLNADPDVVGKQVVVNGNSFSIVGVAAAGFTGTDPTASTDIWMPITQWANILKTVSPAANDQKQKNSTAAAQSDDKGRLSPDHNWLQMIGRLKPGVTLQHAEAAMTTIAARLQIGSRVPQSGWTVTLSPVTAIHPEMQEAIPVGIVIVALTGLILLICCVNVASLMLARAIVRRKEFAIRMALGGSRGRIMRQLLTEAVLLSIGGGALGLLFAYWTTRTVLGLLPPGDLGFSGGVAFDQRVLLFSFVVSLLTALMFGLLPALISFRLDIVGALGANAMSVGGKRRINLRRVLVVMQIVASLVLLISAGLFLRGFQKGEAVSQSFRTDRILLLNLNPTQYGYSIKYNKAFYRELLSRIAATPGVEAATLSNVLPLTMDRSTTFVKAEGGDSMRVQQSVIADGYFKALDISILQGRQFETTDDDTTRKVVIINEALARTLWPGQNALGRMLRTGAGETSEVVGIARNSPYNSFGSEAEPFMYVPLYQELDNTALLIVRTSGEPRGMMTAVQREIKALGGNLPVFDFKTLEDVLKAQLLPLKAAAALLGFLSLLGLVVASIGIYGVTSYSFSQRTKEIGIRVALGADRSEILRLMMKEGIILALVGIAIGVLLSVATTHLASGFLFGVSPVDPLVFFGVAAILTLVAIGATLVPAMLATKLNPVDALRHE
ncbi:MAG TPA: ABC transporter permease [Pyrinomonadaceae bacterium]|nr:ABC transporter permease [Pyrinomonadaceae bacterium]